ncbi:MAG: hypothetical protein N2445_05065, partial [Acidobacteria bacterium]|nr:hypothetical protein [Acidobacteriota bacterium]
MAKNLLFITVIFLSICAVVKAETYDGHTLCEITVSSKEAFKLIYKMRLDIVGRKGDVYKAILTEEEMRLLEKNGIKFKILYDEMALERAERATPGFCSNTAPPCYYIASKFNMINPPSGSLMEHLLNLYNANPNVVRLYDIGDSQDGA